MPLHGYELGMPMGDLEAIDEAFKGHRRTPNRAPDIADLHRVGGPEAAQFRQMNPGADIYDHSRFLQWKRDNPDGTVEDWTRLETQGGR